MKTDLTREKVFELMKKKGFAIFENDAKPFNLNIIGVRNPNAKLDEFGDQLLVAWKYKGVWEQRSYRITTYPGKYYLTQKLLSPKGCAILAEGQYRGIYALRLHNGKYEALCQTHGPVRVFRDKNKDEKFDLIPEQLFTGDYGINIHNSPDNACTIKVGSHSAGCQVFSCDNDFVEFRSLCRKSRDVFGNKFTYTLINR